MIRLCPGPPDASCRESPRNSRIPDAGGRDLFMPKITASNDPDDDYGPDSPFYLIKAPIGAEQRYLAAIVEHSSEVILSQNRQGSILSWNRSAEIIYGYKAQEILGRSILALFPADRSDDILSVLARVWDGQPVERLETVWQCKNGRSIDVALTFSPIRSENDVIVGISTVARDIAREKKLKSDLDRERALIESAFNALRDIFFVIDLSGRLVRWNDCLRTVSGYADEELTRMSALDFFASDARGAVVRAIDRVIQEGNAHLEADGLAKDGRVIPFDLIGSILLDEEGRPFAICGIARDISQRRQAEETLRLTQFAIDHCSDAAYWMEPDGRIFYVNREACRILGYTREELLGMSVYDIDPNFYAATWTDHWQLIQEKHSLSLESVHRTRSGCNIPVDISANYVRFGDREYNCIFARDLTEKKRTQQKTREYEIRMHMSQRMQALGTLAGGIAHDFNNILSSMLGFSELALDTITENTELHDNVREIFAAGIRARDLVRQILTFSRHAEHDKQPLQFKIVVKEALKLLRASIPATIDIRSDLRSDRLVMADPSQMHQIVMNLCANGSHAMQPEGGVLEVTLKTVELTVEHADTLPDTKPGAHIELTVSDTGQGIEPGILDRIFDPFFTTKKQGEGTGLGLSMVHGIVSEHGGQILVRSNVGRGTTFTVYLPVLERPGKCRIETDRELPTGNERILLVDDEPSLAKMAATMLQRLNYQVTHLTSGIEALAYFSDNPACYDLVITDLTMPFLPGHKLAAKLKDIRPEIPVIICTGYNDRISEDLLQTIGIQSLLIKPIEKSQLAATVREVLDSRAL